MSAASVAQPDYGFWEFVSCGRCQLPFISPSGATVPFWLTECGHLVCNNHLNANQSCSICGSPGIQLVPLQREMEAPMSEWFQSVPTSLDTIANAAKFQHETMASQIRYYRARHQQQRALIERLKHDVGDLKKLNEQLQGENDHYRGQTQSLNGVLDISSHDALNSNGKRSRTGAHSYGHRGIQGATSSPRSITTPLGPNRLTLPHNQTAPNLSSGNTGDTHDSSAASNPRLGANTLQHRPGSAFVDKYAYVPPSTPQLHRPQLTHDQVAPQTFKRTKPNPEAQQTRPQQPQAQNQVHRSMLPPPTPARFKAARVQEGNNTTNSFSRHSHGQGLSSGHSGQELQTPGEPPQMARQHHSGNPQNSSAPANRNAMGPTRFFPPTQRFVPPVLTGQTSTGQIGNGPQRFDPAGSRAPSRAQRPDFGNGGQRVPFLPRDQRDDGYI